MDHSKNATEITPEMIQAGEEAVWENLRAEPDADFSARDLAIAVFEAMASVRVPSSSKLPR